MSWLRSGFVMGRWRPVRLGALFAVAQLLVFGFLPCAFANGGYRNINLEFHDHTLTANIEKASLPDVVAEIEESQDIWVKGMDRVPPLEYSVEFKEVPLRKGIERILSTVNHCLVFDEEGELDGIIFLTSPGTVSKHTVADQPGRQAPKRPTPPRRFVR